MTSKSFRKCTATAARRQNSYQQTNKQYVSSIINYKNTFKVILFSKHCFSNFSSSNFGDFTAVFGLLSRPCGLYNNVVMMTTLYIYKPQCLRVLHTAVQIVPVKGQTLLSDKSHLKIRNTPGSSG